MNYKDFCDSINSLVIYKNIKNNKIIKLLENCLSDTDNIHSLAALASELVQMAENNGFSGNLFKSYVIHLMLRDENTFTLLCENHVDIKGQSLYELAKLDINTINSISNIDLRLLAKNTQMENILNQILDYNPVNSVNNNIVSFENNLNIDDIIKYNIDEIIKLNINEIIKYNNKYGCGDISAYKSFRYDDKGKKLIGIPYPDPITFDNLIGYEAQTTQLIDNTTAFLSGYNANNILLVGARGTGKSSSVKALVNKFFDNGLRIVEITKEQIINLPDILNLLRNRGNKFIIYIDDLSFDESEIQYKYMKSLLEGGSEGKPDNVLFYATSNRRHLIQEKWSDRASDNTDAEIHIADTLNEKLSLADRFGITISYPKPTPIEYITIVLELAKEENLDISEDEIKRLAMAWELKQKGRSGRTAKQFIENLRWQLSNKH